MTEKVYNVTLFNKATESYAEYKAHGVKDLIQSMVELTSFYQPKAIELLAKLMNIDVDAIVDNIINQKYLYIDNAPQLKQSLMFSFENEDDELDANGFYFSFHDENDNEQFSLEAIIER